MTGSIASGAAPLVEMGLTGYDACYCASRLAFKGESTSLYLGWTQDYIDEWDNTFVGTMNPAEAALPVCTATRGGGRPSSVCD